MTKISSYVTGLTEDTTPDKANDMLMAYDASAAGMKKVKMANIGGTGDMSGPSSSVNNNLAAFDGVTGKLMKDTGIPAPLRLLRTVVAAGGQASFDVSSIPATYDKIVIDLLVRSEVGGTVKMFYNNDTTDANYRQTRYYFGTSSGTPIEDNALITESAGSSSSAGMFTQARIEILRYADTIHNKTATAQVALPKTTNSDIYCHMVVHTWESTVAINRITINLSTGADFEAGSFCLITAY